MTSGVLTIIFVSLACPERRSRWPSERRRRPRQTARPNANQEPVPNLTTEHLPPRRHAPPPAAPPGPTVPDTELIVVVLYPLCFPRQPDTVAELVNFDAWGHC
jgi:hypothetical protein